MTEGDGTLDLLVEAVRRFAREQLVPAESEVEETEEVPERLLQGMRELGLYGITTPQAYGGLGLSVYEEVRLIFEIAWASPVFRARFGTTNGVGTLGLVRDGTEAQRQRYLPHIARGELVASFCLTEPDAGSDAASLVTRAERDGEHYVINGTKRYITNAIHAGLFTVFARTGPKEAGTAGISAFLVERGTPGLTVTRPYPKMGFHGSHESDVIFEDCRVPAEALLGGREGTGFRSAMQSLDHARIHMAAVATGMAFRMIDEGVRYARERRQFGRPIAQFQLIQGMLADCQAEAYAARAMVEKAAREHDAGMDVTMASACCKYFATEAAGRIADRVLQIHGGAGYVKAYPIERLYRDVRLLRIFEGTSQIQQIVIARQLLDSAG